MKNYLKATAWEVIEDGFFPEHNRITESLCSLGNGRMGQRGNFEEHYSGDTFSGNYIAGIYYPDKTRVGWWKNGYPEYFAKVLNAANWIGIDIFIGNRQLDLNNMEILEFKRTLNMQEGVLSREFKAKFKDGPTISVKVKRFCSMVDDECGAIAYEIQSLDFDGSICAFPTIDFDVVNEDSNYDEKFWKEVAKDTSGTTGWVHAATKKLDYQVCSGMKVTASLNGNDLDLDILPSSERDKYVELMVETKVSPGDTFTIYKFAANVASINYEKSELSDRCQDRLDAITAKGFDRMLMEQKAAWAHKWERNDIIIEGDILAQQGIRFNIFQLNQTYTGADKRLNIGPKGFTGEKYGGSTYWDTEAYCIPFYLSTSPEQVSRNLLIYRHNQLGKAIENAEKLGFSGGAALYPMVTMNGEECHNEWEITFEEIHRNGAIAYAIYDYVRYTGDEAYLAEYGLDVLIGIARFWSQRIHFSTDKRKYVMLGVTGPNEYENNVNNNWYTNYIACWCLSYTMEAINKILKSNPERWAEIADHTRFDMEETERWHSILENMYYPRDEVRAVYLQQDGFLDKELTPVAALDPRHLPLNQKWSWDRILRSCYIKQADVLQGLYFFEDRFDEEEIRRNFDFYEPLTVHESSLSPCVHAILASVLGYEDKAYEMYLRTARLDLDDYNNDTEDGCHITSMAGTWMAVVKGFGGQRVYDDVLHFAPFIPKAWTKYSFKLSFRGAVLEISVDHEHVKMEHLEGFGIECKLFDQQHSLKEGNVITHSKN